MCRARVDKAEMKWRLGRGKAEALLIATQF